MAGKNLVSEERVTTPIFRLAFPHIFQAAPNLQGKLKFSIVMLFDNEMWSDGSLNPLKTLVNELVVKKWGKTPDGFFNCFKDGNTKTYDGYEDTIFASAASEYQRPVVDGGNQAKGIKPQEIINPAEVYAGCYCKASVNAYTWEVMGKTGVSFGLLAIQKTKDGKPFSRFAGAEADFDPITPELAAPDGGGDGGGGASDLTLGASDLSLNPTPNTANISAELL